METKCQLDATEVFIADTPYNTHTRPPRHSTHLVTNPDNARHLILRTQIPPNLQITIYIFTERNTTGSNHCTRVGTLIVATIYLQLIQNRYMFRSFTVLQCSHLHCVQPVVSDVEVVGYL